MCIKYFPATSKLIDSHLSSMLIQKGNKFVQSNVYVYNWESDIFAITKADYAYEYEIKISRSDFKADFKKKKHEKFAKLFKSKDNNKSLPNYFYYVCPEGLIKKEEIPEYAGLIYISSSFKRSEYCQPAPLIHKTYFDEKKFKRIAFNLGWKYRDVKKQVNELERELDYYKTKLKIGEL